MICHMPFVVGVGQLSDQSNKPAVIAALANAWGGTFLEYSCSQCPDQILSSLPREKGLVNLTGDVAITRTNGMSWLEALGAWRQPIILTASPLSSGDIPGSAAAYVALCAILSVPLIGIVQVGGVWRNNERRLDGLPWCGCIQKKSFTEAMELDNAKYDLDVDLQALVALLKGRIRFLNL